MESSVKKVLVVDVGGTNVKVLATRQDARREFPSGPTMTAKRMVSQAKKISRDWRCPAQVVNDAAMQALRSYKGGKMLFLGLGTGLGSSMIVDGTIEPMELGHLPYKGTTYEDHVGIQGLKRLGKKKWPKRVADVVSGLVAAFEPGDVVLGGGNVRKLKELPPGCRAGNSANAFRGGFALWNRDDERERTAASLDAGQVSDDRPRIS
jgi:polyphosphate glucokinase